MMQDLYFFEIVWEIACLQKKKWQTGKCILRSAVQVFSDSLFRFGPDLVEIEEPYIRPDLEELIGMAKRKSLFGSSDSGYRKTPGEPRLMVANHGRRISEKQVLYELWEDSGLQVLNAEMIFIEPLIYCHAFKALLKHVQDKFFSAAATNGNFDFMTAGAKLCVKKKSQRIETVLNSETRITGETGKNFGMDLYGDIHHTLIPENKVQYAFLVPEEADFRNKAIHAGRISASRHAGLNAVGNHGIAVRAPGEPERDYVVLPVNPGEDEKGNAASCHLASSFLAHMNFHEEPSGLLWIF